jgi:hypothetical protein
MGARKRDAHLPRIYTGASDTQLTGKSGLGKIGLLTKPEMEEFLNMPEASL